MRIAHIITDTDTGGAELMLAKLLRGMNPDQFHNSVLSLLPVDNVGHALRADGFSVESPRMRAGLPSPQAFARIVSWIRAQRPVIVQTWMYHSDLLGGIAGRYFADVPVIWNIRQSNLDPAVNSASTMRTARICARFSGRVPEAIVCGSDAAYRTHSQFGYASEKMEVIPNGFDTGIFRPDQATGDKLRWELQIPREALVIGLAARLDPQKDHENFFRAARLLTERLAKSSQGNTDSKLPAVYFVLCGENIEWDNPKVKRMVGESQDGPFGSRVRLLGRRHDLASLYPAFDVSGTSSIGEGFPNVVGEAMACAVPCVVTDVGDSARLVGETGLIVSPSAPEELASAWDSLVRMSAERRRELGMQARARIEKNYSIAAVAQQYGNLYSRIYWGFYGEDE